MFSKSLHVSGRWYPINFNVFSFFQRGWSNFPTASIESERWSKFGNISKQSTIFCSVKFWLATSKYSSFLQSWSGEKESTWPQLSTTTWRSEDATCSLIIARNCSLVSCSDRNDSRWRFCIWEIAAIHSSPNMTLSNSSTCREGERLRKRLASPVSVNLQLLSSWSLERWGNFESTASASSSTWVSLLSCIEVTNGTQLRAHSKISLLFMSSNSHSFSSTGFFAGSVADPNGTERKSPSWDFSMASNSREKIGRKLDNNLPEWAVAHANIG